MQEFKVPQNVDVEDKLIGPLSFKQFFMVLGGSMLSYLIFNVLITSSFPFILTFIVSLIPAVISGSFALIKIDGQPLARALKAGVLFLTKPSRRVFFKQPFVEDIEIKDSDRDKAKKNLPKKDVTLSRIEELSHVLDTEGWAETRNGNILKQE